MITPLLEDFYQIQSLERTGEYSFSSHIRLNPDHAIFKGHFPENPITPGVCMIQIIKELTENFCQCPLLLQSANNVKFMAIINPFETPDLFLDFTLDENDSGIKIKNTTTFGETLALKLSIQFSKQ